MYLYLDESGVDGNINLKNEVKFTNKKITKKVKDKVFIDIKDKYKTVFSFKKYKKKNIKIDTEFLIAECIEKVYKKSIIINVIYDKVSLKIDKKSIQKCLVKDFDFNFEMLDSKRSHGIQISDWVVGYESSKINTK